MDNIFNEDFYTVVQTLRTNSICNTVQTPMQMAKWSVLHCGIAINSIHWTQNGRRRRRKKKHILNFCQSHWKSGSLDSYADSLNISRICAVQRNSNRTTFLSSVEMIEEKHKRRFKNIRLISSMRHFAFSNLINYFTTGNLFMTRDGLLRFYRIFLDFFVALFLRMLHAKTRWTWRCIITHKSATNQRINDYLIAIFAIKLVHMSWGSVLVLFAAFKRLEIQINCQNCVSMEIDLPFFGHFKTKTHIISETQANAL